MIEHDRTRLIGPCFFYSQQKTAQMTKKLMIAMGALLLAACSGQYVGVPRNTVLSYQARPTYGHLYDMTEAYAVAINNAVAEDTMHPGMYAEYGVALALMGHDGEACLMLNAEARAFPQSRLMVQRIKQRLMPDLLADTMAPLYPLADIDKLHLWAYDSVKALLALPPIAAVIDSTDTARIMEQTPVDSVQYPIRLTANQKREMLAEEQAKAEKRRQFVADSIAAAKQAAIDARKQAQADRQADKKAKQEARKKADKQKKQAAKEKEKQRKQEQAQREAERREQKKKGGKQ